MQTSNFKPGQLVRRIHKLTGRESDWDCFLLLTWHEFKPFVASEIVIWELNNVGSWEALTPDGKIKTDIYDSFKIWEVVSE